MSTAGAGAYDRYHRPSTVLSVVTGFVEVPHERLMVQWSELLKVVATGVGELGAIEAYGIRSKLKSFDTQGFQQLAAFQDGKPAIARNNAVGKGSATHFAFHPSLRFPNMNPYTGTSNFDQFENFNDGTLPYLKEFLKNAGVMARVTVSSQQIETPLLVSTAGAVVTLLDWRPDGQQHPSINVTVRLDFDVSKVTAVRAGLKLPFTSVKQGREFVISFSTEVMHCDFITLDAKKETAAVAPLKTDDRSFVPTYPLTSLMDGRALLKARNDAKNGTAPAYAAVVAELTALADQQLTKGPFSVTNGTFLPPTGDMHDYLSVAGYMWPPNTTCNASLLKQIGVESCDRWCGTWDPGWANSTTTDCNWTLSALKEPGEPTGDRWYPHSGYNGELWSRVDRLQLEGLEAAVFPLAMAWWYTSKSVYLDRVVHLLRVWFLDPATRMNPRLDYGAHIPGAFDGCPSGIVDFGNMPWIFDAIRLVTFAGSPTWTPDDERGFLSWITEFHQWFDTAPNSKLALKISNDIGTTVIKVGMTTSLFAGDQTAAKFLAVNHSAVMLSRLLGPTGAFSHDRDGALSP